MVSTCCILIKTSIWQADLLIFSNLCLPLMKESAFFCSFRREIIIKQRNLSTKIVLNHLITTVNWIVFRWRGRHLYTEFICCCIVVLLLYCCCIVVAAISRISLFVINKMMSTYSEDSLGFSAESWRILQNLVASCRIL